MEEGGADEAERRGLKDAAHERHALRRIAVRGAERVHGRVQGADVLDGGKAEGGDDKVDHRVNGLVERAAPRDDEVGRSEFEELLDGGEAEERREAARGESQELRARVPGKLKGEHDKGNGGAGEEGEKDEPARLGVKIFLEIERKPGEAGQEAEENERQIGRAAGRGRG